ncbi:MAG: hypothetical protein JXA44_13075 [Methanospirillaceae archaeon]|nr:hypothetical protein [Methanospirillaceae archaeon]
MAYCTSCQAEALQEFQAFPKTDPGSTFKNRYDTTLREQVIREKERDTRVLILQSGLLFSVDI